MKLDYFNDHSNRLSIHQAVPAVSTHKSSSAATATSINSQGGKLKRISAKQVIYHKSASVDKIYMIRNGLVKLLCYLPNGRARIVRLHGVNRWIGLEGLLGQVYEHTAIAVDDVEIEYFSIGSMQQFDKQNRGSYSQLLSQWQRDLLQADKWISDFSTGGLKPRVAKLISYLAELEYGHASTTVELLTVHEMAEILGVTAESVSRILAMFKRNGVLKKQPYLRREIYHLDHRKLENESLL